MAQNIFWWQPICDSDKVFTEAQLRDLAALYDIGNIQHKTKQDLCAELNSIWKEQQVSAINSKAKCNNKESIHLTPTNEIPPEYLMTIQDSNLLWCFDIRELDQLFAAANASNSAPKNPYTRNPLPMDKIQKQISKMNKLIVVDKSGKMDVVLSLNQRLSLLIADIAAIYADFSISGLAGADAFLKANTFEAIHFARELQKSRQFNVSDALLNRLKSENNVVLQKIMILDHVYNILKRVTRADTTKLHWFMEIWNTFATEIRELEQMHETSVPMDELVPLEKREQIRRKLGQDVVVQYENLMRDQYFLNSLLHHLEEAIDYLETEDFPESNRLEDYIPITFRQVLVQHQPNALIQVSRERDVFVKYDILIDAIEDILSEIQMKINIIEEKLYTSEPSVQRRRLN